MSKMFAKDTNRGHANERMKTSFANSGRIAGAGVLYDNYSEDSYPIGETPAPTEGTPAYKKRTKKELDFIQKGGEIKTYRLSKVELEEMGYSKEVHND